jgi:hypothetical protein
MTDLHAYGFHARHAPESWRDHACAELAPLIACALDEDAARIAGLGRVDVKMPHLVIVLDRPPGAAVLALADEMRANGARLRCNPGAILCIEHYSTLEWATPEWEVPAPIEPPAEAAADAAPSLWQRLRGLFRTRGA